MNVGRFVRLDVRAPFHFEATVRVLQRRPLNRVDIWAEDRYVRAIATADGPVLLEVENRGTIAAPDLRYAVRGGTPSAETRRVLTGTLRRMLGLDVDTQRFERLATRDPRLRPQVRALRGMRPPRFPALFETFVNVIAFQQLSLDAGVAIVARVVERFGERLECEGRRYFAFPDAHRVAGAPLAALRGCGLSARKAATVRDIARAIDAHELDESQIAGVPTAEAIRRLLELPGIGPWSAGLVLLRGFGRLDVFPPGDVGAARGLRTLMGLPPQAPLEPVIERFGDLRGCLYFYALGTGLLRQGLIHRAPDHSGSV